LNIIFVAQVIKESILQSLMFSGSTA